MHGLIYKVTNIETKKVYIGKTTKTLEERKREHLYECNRTSLTYISYFYSALKIYGWDKFKWEILGYCISKEELNQAEKLCIQFFNSTSNLYGYNINIGGSGGDNITYNPNKEFICKKISNSLMGRSQGKKTDAQRAKMSAGMRGVKKNLSPEQRKQWSERARIRSLSKNQKRENNPTWIKNIDVEDVILMRKNNIPFHIIANKYSCSDTAIKNRIKFYNEDNLERCYK